MLWKVRVSALLLSKQVLPYWQAVVKLQLFFSHRYTQHSVGVRTATRVAPQLELRQSLPRRTHVPLAFF